MSKRIVVCVTGSTGAIYGYRLLLACGKIEGIETHVVISKGAEETIKHEVGLGYDELANH